MQQLREEGRQPSWRGSEVVWQHEKGHWRTIKANLLSTHPPLTTLLGMPHSKYDSNDSP